MRLFSATLATETNTFSPLPTSLDSYRETVFLRPGEHPHDAPQMCTSTLFVARRRATRDDFILVEGSCFAASPAGMTNRRDYETMRDEILEQVAAALPLDGVLLGLHGAMVAHGYDDVEGDIIERVRGLVGADCVIGVELDPHCHLTLKRVRLADVIVLYKEFPHTDVVECAEALLDIVLATIRGQVRPVSAMYDCRQIGSYPTSLPLMRNFVDRIKAMEGKDGVLSISIGHCFPYADVPEVTGRILVVTDGDKAKANRIATEIGEEFVAMRGKSAPEYFTVVDGVAAALAEPQGPVVIADPADNAGGGAPTDNTTILRHLIEIGAEHAAIGPIWDPVAVRLCFDAGLGCDAATSDRREDRTGLRSADRRIGGGDRPEAGLLAELWSVPVAYRRLCGRASGRGRSGIDREAQSGIWPGVVHECRNRPDQTPAARGKVDQPFHGGIWANCEVG